MKRVALIAVLVALIVAAGIIRGNTFSLAADLPDAKAQPTLTVYPPLIKVHKNTSFVIMGSGFQPGEQIRLTMPDANGLTSELWEYLAPKPEPGDGVTVDSFGNFACLYVFGRSERVQQEGIYTITANDNNYSPLAVAPIGMADPGGRCRIGDYPRGEPDYTKNPDDPRPLPWVAPFFEYPEKP